MPAWVDLSSNEIAPYVAPPGMQAIRLFAGAAVGGSQVVATETQAGGNTVIHLEDGSTITVVGADHVDASFFH